MNKVNNVLLMTSSLLAITVEVGLITGGIYIFKKLSEPEKTEAIPAAVGDPDCVLVPTENKATFKQRWDKIGRIVKAVVG